MAGQEHYLTFRIQDIARYKLFSELKAKKNHTIGGAPGEAVIVLKSDEFSSLTTSCKSRRRETAEGLFLNETLARI